MSFLLLKVLVLVIGIAGVWSSCEEMEAAGVVPDVIDKCPKENLKVQYANVLVNVGEKLKPSEASKTPTVDFTADPHSMYTLCMVDPDAPSRMNPKFKEWLHWLAVNVPGNSLSGGSTLAEYQGPTPPKGTGKHRYVILVFKQPGNISEDDVPKDLAKSLSTRRNFNIGVFAQHFKFGDPVAGNFFYSQTN